MEPSSAASASADLNYRYLGPRGMRLNRFLLRMRHEEFRQEYARDPRPLLEAAQLTDAEIEAALARDTPALVALGAHPLLAARIRIYLDVDAHPEKYEFY